MKVQTNTLIDVALDWAVAKALGVPVEVTASSPPVVRLTNHRDMFEVGARRWAFNPSTDWAQGGPIIASIKEYCQEKSDDECYCSTPSVAEDWHNHPVEGTGPNPLVAAMRCFVASKLGDTVDVPDELLEVKP